MITRPLGFPSIGYRTRYIVGKTSVLSTSASVPRSVRRKSRTARRPASMAYCLLLMSSAVDPGTDRHRYSTFDTWAIPFARFVSRRKRSWSWLPSYSFRNFPAFSISSRLKTVRWQI